MKENCQRETEELHKFFEDWFSGVIENSDENFERLSSVIAQGFSLVSPQGVQASRDSLLDSLRDAHASFSGEDQSFKIWIKNFDVAYIAKDILLATYEEWQNVDGEENARISTVLFNRNESAPNGVEWNHVHETMLP
jgi:hypothetical protein